MFWPFRTCSDPFERVLTHSVPYRCVWKHLAVSSKFSKNSICLANLIAFEELFGALRKLLFVKTTWTIQSINRVSDQLAPDINAVFVILAPQNPVSAEISTGILAEISAEISAKISAEISAEISSDTGFGVGYLWRRVLGVAINFYDGIATVLVQDTRDDTRPPLFFLSFVASW